MLKTVKKHMRVIKTCNLYISFFTMGMSYALTGPCLLDLQHLVHTDTRHIALIYTARSIGYLVGAIVGGIVLDLVKSRQSVLLVCNFFVALTAFGIPWSRHFEMLLGFMIVNGLALGAIETGANVVCLQLWGKDSGPFFQALHFSFGVGSLISPLIAAPFLGKLEDLPFHLENATHVENPFNYTDALSGYDNITVYVPAKLTYPFSIAGACGLLVTILYSAVVAISPTEEGEIQSENVDNSDRSIPFMFFAVIFTFMTFFVAIGTEIGFGQTLATYAVKGRLHATTTVGSYATSAFWAAFTLSRLCSVFLAIKINNLVLVIANVSIVAVSGLVLLFLMPSEWALWSAAVIFGVGIGPMYAVLFGWVGLYINVTNRISALITVGCAAGEMVVPFLITYFMESIPEMLAYVTAGSCVIVAGLLFVLHCIYTKGHRKVKESKKTECYVIASPPRENGSEDTKVKNGVC